MMPHFSQIVNIPLTSLSANTPSFHIDLEPELIYVNEALWQSLQSIKKSLAPHQKSKRVNPKYILFKLLSGRVMTCEKRCNPRQSTIGNELKRYGYDKCLGERQIRRLSEHLKLNLKILNYEVPKTPRREKINIYTLTELGELAYWFIVKANKGRKQVKVSESPPMDYDELKKCPVSDEENVRSYIEVFYNEYSNYQPQEDFSQSPLETPKQHQNFQATGSLPTLMATADRKEADKIMSRLTENVRISASKKYDNFARVNQVKLPINYLRYCIQKAQNEIEVNDKIEEERKRLAEQDRQKSLRLLKECENLNMVKDEWEEGIRTEEARIQKELAIQKMREINPDFSHIGRSAGNSFRRRYKH
jgi:hypothetical protein